MQIGLMKLRDGSEFAVKRVWAVADVGAIVHRLTAGYETGVLHLREGGRQKKLYFLEGRPDFIASTDRNEMLGEQLVSSHVCLRMEVDMALAGSNTGPLVTILLGNGNGTFQPPTSFGTLTSIEAGAGRPATSTPRSSAPVRGRVPAIDIEDTAC